MGYAGCYKTLHVEFAGKRSQYGNQFTQIARVGDVCIYEKIDRDSNKSYEVIMVTRRERKVGRFNGVEVVFEATEVYPSDEDFGSTGWAYGTLEVANNRFTELSNSPRVTSR